MVVMLVYVDDRSRESLQWTITIHLKLLSLASMPRMVSPMVQNEKYSVVFAARVKWFMYLVGVISTAFIQNALSEGIYICLFSTEWKRVLLSD